MREYTKTSSAKGSVNTSANILVADDSATMRMIVAQALQQAGWTVRTACNGADALQQAGNQPPDLIVTDWNMPVMGGLDLVRSLHAAPVLRAVPVLVLTTESDGEDQCAARSLGVKSWIYKPVDPALLLERVALHLGAPMRKGAYT